MMAKILQRKGPAHTCALPNVDGLGRYGGRHGDLWGCDRCRKVWRAGDACDMCDSGYEYHRGQCTWGLMWRPAGFWARRRYPEGSEKLAKATMRKERHDRRVRRYQDLIGGTPSKPSPRAASGGDRD